jgi:hypothetical protein
MKEFCIFSIILGICCSSSFSSPRDEEFNDFKLMVLFRKFRDHPEMVAYAQFDSYVHRYSSKAPLDCLKSLEKYQSDYTFVVTFWRSFKMSCDLKNPSIIDATDYLLTLRWMIRELSWIFMGLSTYGPTFETHIEIASFLVRIVENGIFQLGPELSVKEQENMREKLSIGKFLIKNARADFTNKLVNYTCIIQTINELKGLILRGEASESIRQAKLFALLWFHLCHIHRWQCRVVFDLPAQSKVVIIYLLLKMQHDCPLLDPNEEFYSQKLEVYFTKLYAAGSLDSSEMEEFLNRQNPRFYSRFIKGPKKRPRKDQAFPFSDCMHFEFYNSQKWQVQAFAQLEYYVFRNK